MHNSNVRLTSQGIARDIMKEELEKRPFNMRIDNLMRSSKKLCNLGNLQHVKSATTTRKMNSKHKARLDYDKDPFLDV